MNEHIAQCRYSRDDRITAHVDGPSVLLVTEDMDVYLRPDAARTFARGILALADEIDGGEVKEEPKPTPAKREIKVGDRVRIVRNGYAVEGSENVGRVGTLEAYDPEDDRAMYRVSLPDDGYGWWCAEVELVDDPVNEPDVPINPRLTYFRQAEAALTDFEHTAADIIALARFLAGE